MLAVFAASIDRKDPLSGLTVGEQPEPDPPHGWTVVSVKAASLNHHDLWSLRGVGLNEDRLPMILGCDAAGLDEDGNEVIVHSVISSDAWRGDETFDPQSAPVVREASRDARRAGRGAAAQPRAQAARAHLRGGGLPADGVADRLPDAVHPRPRRPGDDGARPGRRRRGRDRACRARECSRGARVGDEPLRGEARSRCVARVPSARSSPASGFRSASTS